MASTTGTCNCFTGKAVIDANGNCTCVSDYSLGGAGGLLPKVVNNTSTVPATTATTVTNWFVNIAESVTTFAKDHPYILIGGAALLYWFLFMRHGRRGRGLF